MEINAFLRSVVTTLQLGKPLSEPTKLHGGFMHLMFALHTTTGSYAIKLLNPNVMKRPDAMACYTEAQRLECILQEHSIPIVPALIFDNHKMQELDGQYFYLYEWFEGKTLKDGDITAFHCQKIGEILSRIHHIDMKIAQCAPKSVTIAWDAYISLAKKKNPLLHGMLLPIRELLYDSQRNGNRARQSMPTALTICHNDMDPKNVLWAGDTLRIIDLECLSYANPTKELFELALCWSGCEKGSIHFTLFTGLMNAYFKNEPKPRIDVEALYDSNDGRLEWLEYNVKRALLLECGGVEEQTLGMQQVEQTIAHVIYYKEAKDQIVSCLTEVFAK